MSVNIVTDYSAVGDGTTDNTTAIQNALNGASDIIIPDGDFVCGPLSVAHQTSLRASGYKANLIMKAGTSGRHIDTGQYAVRFEGFRMTGASTSDKRFLTAAENGRIGMVLAPEFNSRMNDVTFDGYGFAGLILSDTYQTTPAQDLSSYAHLSNCTFTNCYEGLRAAESITAEYVIITGCDLNSNCIGLNMRTGNLLVNGCVIKNNGTGLILDGTQYSNNGHGIVNNCFINHSVNYSIQAFGISKGMNLTGNQIQLGNISFSGCTGINISDGTLSVAALTFGGGGRNYVRNNFMYAATGLSNTVTHNSGSNDAVGVENNWTGSGAFSNSYGAAY